MFWNFGKDKLNRENVELSVKNSQLERRIEALEAEIETLKKNVESDASVASMEINFDNMDVFSIERNVSDNKPVTVIGYWLTDKDGVKSNSEWYLFCSAETHEKLVEKFKAEFQAK